jgi:hypothetical protein
MNIMVNLKKKKSFIARITGTVLALGALSIAVSYFAGIPAAMFLYLVVTGFSVVLLTRYGIGQFVKLRQFLTVMDEPGSPKHNRKVMVYSMVKYLACLFILSAFTYGIMIYPMVVVWLYALLFARKYMQLWQYHGYSAGLLVILSGTVIAASIALAPFTRAGIWTVARIFVDVF